MRKTLVAAAAEDEKRDATHTTTIRPRARGAMIMMPRMRTAPSAQQTQAGRALFVGGGGSASPAPLE